MRHRTAKTLSAGVLAAALVAGGAAAQEGADAELMNPDGKVIGNVELTQLEQGVRVFAQASDIEAGTHAFHIHETGECEPPDFESAGGHFNPTDAEHGWDNANGPHAGDFPNVHVEDDGVLAVEYFNDKVTLDDGDAGVFDDDGSAIVIHADADDYQTDPAGDAGSRIACGVIEE